MRNILVVGAQFGDEGKGKVVDLLVQEGDTDVVVRYNGGANAGHTIVLDDGKYPLHLIPSGILHPQVLNIVAAGVVIDPLWLVEEMGNLKSRGIPCENLRISDRAHLVMPWHKVVDAHLGGRIGTTARGIGPCYEDRAGRRGLRVGDLVDEKGQLDKDHFTRRVRELVADKNRLLTRVYDLKPLDGEEILEQVLVAGEQFRDKVADTAVLIESLAREGKSFLYEGAQGTLLDVDWGTYPYVTSSSVSLAGCYLGSGVCVEPELRLGVVKAYGTRVGEGPFPAELGDYETVKKLDAVEPGRELAPPTPEQQSRALSGDDYLMGRWIRAVGREFGTTTGRPRRCGWLDLVVVRHAVRVSGLNALALTKLDVLSGIPRLKLCVAYRCRGDRLESFPARSHRLPDCEPIYEELPGFGSLEGITRWEELPIEARAYVRRVEELAGAPVRVLSIGSHRSQSLMLPETEASPAR
ncbi:MAG: adenylosuccinate synthetase [Armatimonadetes bacterium]|nr:adenylosuccinate synthetase [Armatimonadota bacterium]